MPVSYGSQITGTSVSAWNSLAAAARGGSASIDNTSNLYHAATLSILLKTGSTLFTAGDYVEVWLEGSTDGGSTFGTDQGVLLGTVAVPIIINTNFQVFYETDQVLAILPPNWRITIVNRGAQALNAATNALTYRGKKAA